MQQFIITFFTVLELLVYTYLFSSIVYVFIFSIAGHFYKKRPTNKKINLKKFAVLIPAYKEDSVIVEVARQALRQDYPSSFYDVIVIADSLQNSTIDTLKKLPIILKKVSFTNSTKAKALNAALLSATKSYDYALILDADNVMEKQLLNKINTSFQSGFQVIQAHRKAKNLNTSFAILDAASEEINNHIYRKGHRVLGLSSGLIGSGMAFEFELLKDLMQKITAIGGFDKELEFELAAKNIKVEYLQEAVVLDEKIQKSSDFSNQRRRWLSTQIVYLKRNFTKGFALLVKEGNINFFDKMMQMFVPPRVLLLGATTILSAIYLIKDLVLHLDSTISFWFWVANFAMLLLAFLLALPISFYNLKTCKALVSIPLAFFRMLQLLFKLKGANKQYIHTTHHVINH